MPKTSLPSVETIINDYPDLNFVEDSVFYWSAEIQTIYYDPTAVFTSDGVYRLLHEVGHALCEHSNYTSGIQLVKLEAEAWEKAKQIAKQYNVVIDDSVIEGCLDSYRDWLHLRSTCPQCQTVAVEAESNKYRCFNCLTKWTVPKDQRTRHYRMKLVNSVSKL